MFKEYTEGSYYAILSLMQRTHFNCKLLKDGSGTGANLNFYVTPCFKMSHPATGNVIKITKKV